MLLNKKNKSGAVLLAVCGFGFLFLFSGGVFGATLLLMPQSQTIYNGDTFLVDVIIDSEAKNINAVQVLLNFPAASLEVLGLEKGGSVLKLWPEEPFFSNQKGEINLTGGIPGGFSGQGRLISVNFRALAKIEVATISFRTNSQVLLNNGQGTPVELTFLDGSYEILEKEKGLPEITSPTHPDQNKWHNGSTLHLRWDFSEVNQYSYQLSKDQQVVPDNVPDKPEGQLKWLGEMEYSSLEDGVYYFTLRQKLPGQNWSGVVRYRVMIDTAQPEEFLPEIGKDPLSFGGKYFLTFVAQDKTSGVDHYEVRECAPVPSNVIEDFLQIFKKRDVYCPWGETESPYILKNQKLQSSIEVKAYDLAGNERVVKVAIPPSPFSVKKAALAIALFVVFVIVILLLIREQKKRK